jgi:FkbM family methyltransferase
MSGFDHVYREGVDMRTALASEMKRASLAWEMQQARPDRNTTVVRPGVGARHRVPETWAAKGRSSMRAAARGVFRAAKPVLRPVAIRARAFLLATLEEELRRSRERIDAIGREAEAAATSAQAGARFAEAAATSAQAGATFAEAAATSAQAGATFAEAAATSAQAGATFAKAAATSAQAAASASEAAARRVAVACGPDKVLVRTDVGYILCSAADLGTLAMLIESGGIERGTRLLIQRLIGPGDVFVDVGANLGLHTLAAARAMGGRGRIYAFEPFGQTASLLRESVLINGFASIVEVREEAASDHAGRQPLFVGVVSGHHSLFPLIMPTGRDATSVEVSLARLDDALADAPPVTLVKIDAEGAELEVLEGATSIVQGNPEIALIVEFGPSHLGRAGHSVREWFARFEGLGLAFREIDEETGRLSERAIETLAEVQSVNLLFARPGAHAWLRADAG